jgi:LEA14-like dessication related protein
MENVHDYGITLVGMEYVVTMNDVELGHTQVERGIDVEPGERETLSIRVGLDTPKMADWWPEHVRDGERSNLSVAMYGIAEDDGERKRIPLRLYDERQQLTTDMLGDGDTNVSDVPEPQREETAFPEVEETQQRWGSVTDDTTEIVTTAFLTAGDNNLTEMLSLEVTQQTRINDVLVADGSASVRELEPGENPYDIVAGKDNGLVPTWWARHLNRGEESTVVTTPTAFVDAGFTKFDIELDRRQNTVETDLLADMNGQRDETVTVAGRDALRVQQVSSSWGQATPDEAPLDTTTTLRNRQPTSVTIDAVHYTVTTNGVTLADRTDQVRSVIPAGSTEDVDVQMRLDNSKMDEWWVRHVPEERSTFQVDVEVTVTAGGRTDTVELESLGQSSTVETDMLNQDEE